MGASSADRVLVVTDDATRTVADALIAEASLVTCSFACLRLEDFAERPFTSLPASLAEAVRSFAPTVTFLAVDAGAGEFPMQRRFVDLVTAELGARHAQMVGITESIVRSGLQCDYHLVQKLTAAVRQFLVESQEVRVTSVNGTDLRVRLSDQMKWGALDGVFREPGEWGDLPGGEVFTCPETVDGVLIAEVVGDSFAKRWGRLEYSPLRIEIADGYATGVQCSNAQLADELWAHLGSYENGRRVGEFSIGTNLGIKGLSGELRLDEKVPGVHIALGHPNGDITGATWSSGTHVDLIPSECEVFVDGELFLRRTTFSWLNI